MGYWPMAKIEHAIQSTRYHFEIARLMPLKL